jgi:hypothetical protein
MFEWMKFILAARRKKPDGNLFEIVIFIAIAVIYALSGIFKMRSGEKDSKKIQSKPLDRLPRDEQIKTGPRYKPLADASAPPAAMRGPKQRTLPYAKRIAPKQTAPSRQMRQVRAPQQQPRPQRAAPPTAKEVIRQALEPFFEPQQPVQRAQSPARPARRRPVAGRPKTAEETARQDRMDKAQATAARPPKAKEPAAPAAAVSKPAAFASLEHLLQQDNLKMAIVYAEILAQPVGLRDM